MRIQKNKVVTIDYVLKDGQGNIVDQSGDGQFSYLHGANNIVSGLENALDDKAAGDNIHVRIMPREAYGDRDEALVEVVPRDMFPAGAEITAGMQFHAQTHDNQPMIITVLAVDGDQVTIDGNHPLAGETLDFTVDVIDVRDATADEIRHGHAHHPGGASH